MTTVNGGLNPAKPWESSALRHQDAGWIVFPLPDRDKYPPERGATGWNGIDRTVEAYAGIRPRRNVGLRMPVGVIGIDVDCYDTKEGWATLQALIAKCGPLPSTPVLTSREDGRSGIRFFRVPDDTVIRGLPGPGIESLQRHHRYAVAAASVHPSTRKPYRWLAPSGVAGEMTELPDVPRVADLPQLPTEWLEELQRGASASRGGTIADDATVQAWLVEHRLGEPCDRISQTLATYDGDIADGKSRHEAMTVAQMSIVGLAHNGHLGAGKGLEELYGRFEEDLGTDSGRDAEPEFARGLAGAIGKVYAVPPSDSGCCGLAARRYLSLRVGNATMFSDTMLSHLPNVPGLFRRGDELVRIYGVHEDGYIPPAKPFDDDGPAQVYSCGRDRLLATLHTFWDLYAIMKDPKGNEYKKAVFAPDIAIRAVLAKVPEIPRMPDLTGVCHTPVMRPDGTVLSEPGYDKATGIVYLPINGFTMPPVPEHPTQEQARAALTWLRSVFSDFVWTTPGSEAAYLGGLLSPVILPMVSSPGPLMITTASMPGTGKTLLGQVMMNVHGGVTRGGFPAQDEEVRKTVFTILRTTTAPVVVFDNFPNERTLRSEALSTVITSPSISDRILGVSDQETLSTMRQYVLNGNNVQVGGDWERRCIWVSIDAEDDKPWLRTGFAIPNLAKWSKEHRGEVIAALITIVRAWVAAGKPVVTDDRGDSMSEWFTVVNGALAYAGLEARITNASPRGNVGEEDDELGGLLQAILDVYGPKQFLTRDIAYASVDVKADGYSAIGMALPGELHDKLGESKWQPVTIVKSLGKYLSRNEGRWANGLMLERIGEDSVRNVVIWRIKKARWREQAETSPTAPTEQSDAREPNAEVQLPNAEVQSPEAACPDPSTQTQEPTATSSSRSNDLSEADSATEDVDGEVTQGFWVESSPIAGAALNASAELRPASIERVRVQPVITGNLRADLEGRTVFFDFETANSDTLFQAEPSESFVRLMTYSLGDGCEVHVTSDPEVMRSVLSSAAWLVGHDAHRFDCLVAARHLGLDVEDLLARTVDTIVMARLVFPPPESVKLEDLASRYLDLPKESFTLPSGRVGDLKAYAASWAKQTGLTDGYAAIPTDDAQYVAYAKRDTELLPSLLDVISSRDDFDRDYALRELRLSRLAAMVTWRGFLVDEEGTMLAQQAEEEMYAEAKASLSVDWGVEFNLKPTGNAARDRVHEVLTDAGFLDLPRTESGKQWSTSADELEAAGVDHPVVDLLRTVATCRGLAQSCLKLRGTDGRVHSSIGFSQRTGRWSVKRPALTTFGKRSERLLQQRKVFRARPGFVLFSADYSQIDVRGLAALSQDPLMIASLQPGMDWHTSMAIEVFGDASRRSDAKKLAHSINYNAGADNVASQVGCSHAEAEAILMTIARKFPLLTSFKERTVMLAKRGRKIPNGWGRLMRAENGSKAHTQAPGLAGQGWARDAVMEGLLRLDDAGLSQYVVCHIHDEYVFEVPEGEAEQLRERIVQVMTFERDGVPVLCEAGPLAQAWDDCYREAT